VLKCELFYRHTILSDEQAVRSGSPGVHFLTLFTATKAATLFAPFVFQLILNRLHPAREKLAKDALPPSTRSKSTRSEAKCLFIRFISSDVAA